MKAEFFKNLEPFSLSKKDKLSFFTKEIAKDIKMWRMRPEHSLQSEF